MRSHFLVGSNNQDSSSAEFKVPSTSRKPSASKDKEVQQATMAATLRTQGLLAVHVPTVDDHFILPRVKRRR
ncbi:MAG: hypothetical protein H0W64_04185 [Gammaproteobacteria bacterium]|nr:hypothetical protein [Gammaproteobacteria bacterium]